LLALVLYPIVWLLTLPFRIVGIAVGGVLGLISALFFLRCASFAGLARFELVSFAKMLTAEYTP